MGFPCPRKRTCGTACCALLNVRKPMHAAPELLRMQDASLPSKLSRRSVTDAAALPEIKPVISLWHYADMLNCDGIRLE